MHAEKTKKRHQPDVANDNVTQARRTPGKRTHTERLQRPGKKSKHNRASATSASKHSASPAIEVDGALPYVDGLQQAFGDPVESAPKISDLEVLPPEYVPGPKDYPDIAHIHTAPATLLEVAPPPHHGDQKKGENKTQKPGSETGIATKVALGRFVTAAKKVEKDWGKLDKNQRAGKLGEAANSELSAASVPKIGVVVKDLGTKDGLFQFTPWNLELNEKPFAAKTVSKNGMASMADTVYHESRHAEQWYRMARLEAGRDKKKTGAQIASALSIKRTVADAAVKNSLSGTGKAAKEAAAWHKSVYGADRKARATTLSKLATESQKLSTAAKKVNDAAKVYNDLKAKKNASAKDLKTALTNWHNAYNAYTPIKASFDMAHAAYKALPEEADAWKLGDRVTAAYKAS